MYTRNEILKLLEPNPAWGGFDNWIYNKETGTLKECLHKVHTSWRIIDNERPTFIDLAKMIIAKTVPEPPEYDLTKIYDIKNGYNDNLIQVPVLHHGDLIKFWPKLYPPNTSTPDSAYVAEDRNHRLTSYALKFLENESIGDIPTEIFYGRNQK